MPTLTIREAERHFSIDRLAAYRRHTTKGDDALALYISNLELSQALYIPLSILEVALRNAIHAQLSRKTGQDNWYMTIHKHPILGAEWGKVSVALRDVSKKNAKDYIPGSGQVIAELMFGFWTGLFNAQYEVELWANLKHCFPRLPKRNRQRKTVETNLSPIRNLRNRVYHCEPICWNLTKLAQTHQRIHAVIYWIDPTLQEWLVQIDTFPSTLARVRAKNEALGIDCK
jgi:hypothetical protein